jgi:uncharacterized protein YqeY
MDTKAKLNESVKDAMKSGDEVRKRTVRMVLAAVKQVEVDKRADMEDSAIVALIQKEIKNRREAIEEAKKANRSDLVEGNEAEIRCLKYFCRRPCLLRNCVPLYRPPSQRAAPPPPVTWAR